MKKILTIILALILVASIFTGCRNTNKSEYNKYTNSFFDTFDTVVIVVGYTKTQEEFDSYFNKIHEEFMRLHKLYDIYDDYEGINNIKTINDNAGIKPVKVDKDIINLITFAKDWYKKTGGKTNIAMGAVTDIWHNYREDGIADPENAKLPSMEELKKASNHMDIDKVIVDTENSTVYLEDKDMRLDVGSVGKGYATELVAQEIMKEGFTSGMISAGGNIRALDKPLDNIRERWGVGIQNPDKSIVSEDVDRDIDTIFVKNASVVSSGVYQRYYIVNDKIYHHLIDPYTLMPGDYYKAVTVVTPNSGLADFLSTTLFLMPYDESRALVESLDDVEALWVMKDGTIQATDGMKKIMKSNGATGAKAE